MSLVVVMRVLPAAPLPAVPALFEALLDVFAPLDVTYRSDDEAVRIARVDPARAFAGTPLWCDEELTRDALTTCSPALATDVVAELHDRLAGARSRAFHLEAAGALRHRAAAADEPAWYGRWRAPAELRAIASVEIAWTASQRSVGLRFPHGGYPCTAVRPRTRGDLVAGDAALAHANRALMLPSLLCVRAALGFDREEVEWSCDGDHAGRYREDRAEIWKTWLPRLAAS